MQLNDSVKLHWVCITCLNWWKLPSKPNDNRWIYNKILLYNLYWSRQIKFKDIVQYNDYICNITSRKIGTINMLLQTGSFNACLLLIQLIIFFLFKDFYRFTMPFFSRMIFPINILEYSYGVQIEKWRNYLKYLGSPKVAEKLLISMKEKSKTSPPHCRKWTPSR